MDKETKLILESIRLQQDLILKNQQDIFDRLETIEDSLELTPQTSPVIQQAEEQFDESDYIKAPKPSVSSIPLHQQENLEFQIGGTLLNRLGAVAIILGLSYFLKYSFDNQWIGPTGRIILGILLGLMLLGVGEKLRVKYFLYSQGLVGAGSLALYFSVFAGYSFYHLMPPYLAFIFLIIVMANTVFTAVRHNSITIGILGIIGGYAAPLLISSPNPLPWVYFGYLVILTCGIMGVSIFKRWDYFRIISFVFNQFLLAIWMFTAYRDAHLVPSLVFVSFNFLAYLTIASGYKIKLKSNVNEAETGLIALNALTFFLWSRLLLENTFLAGYMGFFTLGLALVYIYIGRLAYFLYREDKRQVYTLFAVAIKLITIAIYLQLSYEYIPYGWLLEAFGIFFIASQIRNPLLLYVGLIVLSLGTFTLPVWVRNEYLAFSWLGEALGLFLMGLKLELPQVRYSGIAALTLGSLAALESALGWSLFNSKDFLVNWPTLALALAIALTLLIYLFSKNITGEQDKNIRAGLGIGALLLFLAFLTIENHHFFLLHPFQYFLSPEQLSLSLLWMVYAIGLFVAGIRKDLKGFRYGALGLIAIIILKAFFIDLAGLATIFKILLFIILGFFLLGISFVYQKKRNMFNRSEGL